MARLTFTHVDRHHRRSPRARPVGRRFPRPQPGPGGRPRPARDPDEGLPPFRPVLASLGLLGLHLGEEYGGAGFGLAEVLVVAEESGRAVLPGPYLPTVIASAVLAAAAPGELKQRLLPGLADGSRIGAVALDGAVRYADGAGSGKAGVVLRGQLAGLLLVPAGDDVLVIGPAAGGVTAKEPANLDPSRPAAKVTLDRAAAAMAAVLAIPAARKRCHRLDDGAAQPRDVDRGRDVGDQAQPDRRADPATPPRPLIS
jgi:Acyl-CoA dehydrogenase, N-terminal domain